MRWRRTFFSTQSFTNVKHRAHRYCGPIRHPLAVHPLPRCAGYRVNSLPPISRRGKEGFSSYSTCPCHRAVAPTPLEDTHRVSQTAMGSMAFASLDTCSASGCYALSGLLCVHSRYGPVTRSPSSRWLRQWASGVRFPPLPSKLRGVWLLPRRVYLRLNTSTLLDITPRRAAIEERRGDGRPPPPPHRSIL